MEISRDIVGPFEEVLLLLSARSLVRSPESGVTRESQVTEREESAKS
jgi:hypothetical protein